MTVVGARAQHVIVVGAEAQHDQKVVRGRHHSQNLLVMPMRGVFRSSWMHTHAQAQSVLWVLDVHASKVIPAQIYDRCYETQVHLSINCSMQSSFTLLSL